MTTTFSPAPSCTGPHSIGFGFYREIPVGTDLSSYKTTLQAYFEACETSIRSCSGCIPHGDKVDSQIAEYLSTYASHPRTQATLDYYSPGSVCPQGYITVGTATKSIGGAVSSSGAAFVPSSEVLEQWKSDELLEEIAPNILLQGLLEGESAFLCCPVFVFTSLESYWPTLWGRA